MAKDLIKAYTKAFKARYKFTGSTRDAKTWPKERLVREIKRLEKEKK